MLLFRRSLRAPSRRWLRVTPNIVAQALKLKGLTDAELRQQGLALRYRAQTGETAGTLLIDAFALIREATRRQLGMEHYPVQLLGGIALHHGTVAQMQTGEGKTLTAALALYLMALPGHGAHLATANDYLAARDARLLQPVYESLGMTVGTIESDTPRNTRREAYAADITYGTAKEFGFDFLRDRLTQRDLADGYAETAGLLTAATERQSSSTQLLQRPLHALLADEADSLLIDDARTPLILSALPQSDRSALTAAFLWAADLAPQLVSERDFKRDRHTRSLRLTEAGRREVRSAPKPPEMQRLGLLELYDHAERALRVVSDFRQDRDFVIRDDEVVIVDESTGRFAEGRRWRDGVHQAVEAMAGVPISLPTAHAAQITMQDLMLQYQHLCGMTGTAESGAAELYSIYETPVIRVPTHRPCRRQQLPDAAFCTAEEKWSAVANMVQKYQQTGQPVLIGTRSIDKSEALSVHLQAAGIGHQVLHAKHRSQEADIVAGAGQKGRVTVATNMAGRGTDIELGEGVAELGGLHVIATELHDSARIDRQLIGRCARQGDPGSYRICFAADDDVLRAAWGESRAAEFQQAAAGGRPVSPTDIRKAQAVVERRHQQDRKRLLTMMRQRAEALIKMGQDPHLDTPE